MNRIAVLLLHAAAPALGIILGLLGIATLHVNLLGWLLFLGGVGYTAGTVIMAHIRGEGLLQAAPNSPAVTAGADDRTFWLVAAGMVSVFCLSPLEFLYLNADVLPIDSLDAGGAGVVAAGSGILAWARRSKPRPGSGKTRDAAGHTLLQAGPYRCIRHPDHAGYLLASLGMAIGYGSIYGFAAWLFLLLPAVIHHIRTSDGRLSAQFGIEFQEYAAKTKRLVPGVW